MEWCPNFKQQPTRPFSPFQDGQSQLSFDVIHRSRGLSSFSPASSSIDVMRKMQVVAGFGEVGVIFRWREEF
jgi:hypothetical protein